MRRRKFLGMLNRAVAAFSLAARAQQTLIFATTLMVLATLAEAQELIFSPSISGSGSSQFDATQPPDKSASTVKQGDDSAKWTKLPQIRFIDLYRDAFGTDTGKTIGGNGFKRSKDTLSTSGSANSNDKFSFGNSYLGIETQKKLQMPFKRTDCASDDECADYSGLPKSEPSKRTMKNLRKPFIGLSITTPLQ
jgi:hypothetical protein